MKTKMIMPYKIPSHLLPILLLAIGMTCRAADAPIELWSHLSSTEQLGEIRGLSARFDDSSDSRLLKLELSKLNLALGETSKDPRRGIGWVSIPAPAEGWNLLRSRHLQATVTNQGANPAETTLWGVSSNGWAAVGGAATLEPGESATLTCDLRQTYPDGTPRIDPSKIKEIRIMIQRTDLASVEVSGLLATGTADQWVRPPGRNDVPDMVEGKPAPGRRVRYQLADDADNGIYCAVYLPPDWKPGKRYPVIAEYPGNVMYSAKVCWSTGRPEQCAMGISRHHLRPGDPNGSRSHRGEEIPAVGRPNVVSCIHDYHSCYARL